MGILVFKAKDFAAGAAAAPAASNETIVVRCIVSTS
jgi:hypothetical protein